MVSKKFPVYILYLSGPLKIDIDLINVLDQTFLIFGKTNEKGIMGSMKIDLHVHVKKLSRCAKNTVSEMSQALVSKGIGGACIFDHWYFTQDNDMKEIHDLFPDFIIYKGTEINLKGKEGHKEDLLLISSVQPDFELKNVNPLTIAGYVSKNDVLTVLCHPYRRRDIVDFDFELFVPDCIEISSTHILDDNFDRISVLAKKYGMRRIITSDAHKTNQVGQYFIEVPDGIKTAEELKYILKSGKYSRC